MINKLASLQLFFVLSFFLILFMISGTLVPQNQPPETLQQIFSPASHKILSKLGFFNLYHSTWFVGLLVLLGLNTSACILMRVRGRSFSRLPWGALSSHAAILFILLGGVLSALLGEKGVLELKVHDKNCCVSPLAGTGEGIHLPFEVQLADFKIDYYNAGQHIVQVTHIKEGWKETVEVEPGRNYDIRKTVKLNVLQYVPDLRVEKDSKSGKWKTYSASSHPNNPALQVEVTASPKKQMWLFSKYPELSHFSAQSAQPENKIDLLYQYVPGKIKQFKSKVEIVKDTKVFAAGQVSVNHPFKYGGYTFYQSGYNPEDPSYSSFQVAKDPGVPLVYAGFILLPFGLAFSFYGGKAKKDLT